MCNLKKYLFVCVYVCAFMGACVWVLVEARGHQFLWKWSYKGSEVDAGT